MAQSRGMSTLCRGGALLLSGALMICLLSGCENQVGDGMGDTPLSGTFADLIKPDVNRERRMILDPELVVADFTDTDYNIFGEGTGIGEIFGPGTGDGDEGGGTGGGTGGETGGGNTGTGSGGTKTHDKAETWKRPVNAANFATPTYPVVNASDYGRYLQEQVYDPIELLLEDNKNVYFKVFHMGYDFSSKTVTVQDPPTSYLETKTVPGSTTILNHSKNSSVQSVAGDVHSRYMVEWLGGLEINTTLHNTEIARDAFEKTLSNLVTSGTLEDATTWSSVVDTDLESKVGKTVMTIWSKYSEECENFGKLRALVQGNNWGAVPDLQLSYYTKATAQSTITLNGVSKGNSDTANGSTRVTELSPMFTKYNQFHTREFNDGSGGVAHWGANKYLSATTVGGVTNTYACLSSFTDGYHRTVVYLAAKAGTSLEEELGASTTADILNIINSAYSPKDVTSVLAALEITDTAGHFVPGDTTGKGAS